MAIHKAKVIGPFEVGGVAPGGTVELDDEQVNLPALIDAQLVELEPELSEEPKPGSKADLIARASALGLSPEGTKAELEERIASAEKGGA